VAEIIGQMKPLKVLVCSTTVRDYLKNARTQIKIFNLKGSFIREVVLPGISSAGGFGGKREILKPFYSFTSLTPATIALRHDGLVKAARLP